MMAYHIAGLCFSNQSGLTFVHDPAMVALSFLIACAGGFGALEMIERARGSQLRAARSWQVAAAVTLGVGVWATHFVGILAIQKPLPIELAPLTTFISLALVVIACAVGVLLGFVNQPTWKHVAAGGAIIGIGIIAMHYVGMAAMEMPGPLAYRPGPWLLSAAIAIIAATTALLVAHRLRRKWQRVVAALVLGGGICGMHYIGMYGAVGFFPEEPSIPATFSRELLASTVAGTTGALILLALLLVAADRREAALFVAAKRAEAARRMARRAESRLAAAIEAIPEGFILLDPNDRVVLCNSQYRHVYGLAPGLAAPGVKFETIVRFMAETGLYELEEHSAESWVADRMERHRDCDGSRFYQTLSDGRCVQVQDRRASNGDIVGIRVDVTDARQREAAEHDRQKLAALGQLAGGVAHEINNLLQPILTLPELVLERLPVDDAESSEDLACVTEAARKIRDIVRNILLYARKQEPQLTEVDLVAELRAAVSFVSDLIPSSVVLRADDLETFAPCHAAANKTQLTQVVTNLLVNAAQAMTAAGSVTVSLRIVSVSSDEAVELGVEPERDYLAISVADTGGGMDEAVRAHIFEPFFTTKPPGQGTGLGLSVAYGILRSWQGAITVQSVLGEGTTFTLYVPLSRPAARPQPTVIGSREAIAA
ncbi:MAG: PAS-domain containing protein [Alphaproteobacteria bacterium]|nr:PAS-domain containing protein [Alphaproteobacteria bacterium]